MPEDSSSSSAAPPFKPEATPGSSRDSELHRLRRVRVFEAGETVLAEGDDAGVFGRVIDGVLKMVRSLPDGRVQIIGLIFPFRIFGHLPSIGSAVRIEAATRTTLSYIRHPRMDKLISTNKELESLFLRSALESLDAAREWMIVLGSQTVTQRLATFLVMLRDHAQASPDATGLHRLSVPIRRRDMAAYLGTTPETLSRVIRGLHRDGIIRVEGADRFEIRDMRRLRRLADQD